MIKTTWRELGKNVQTIMDPWIKKIILMVGRGVINLVKDSEGMQKIQAGFLAGETTEDCERPQEYGFNSVPLPDTECIAIFPAGERDHAIIIATNDKRHRHKGLEPGEVCIYTHKNGEGVGHRVIFKADRSIEVKGNDIKIDGDGDLDTTMAGDATVTAGGDVVVNTPAGGVTVNSQLNVAVNTALGNITLTTMQPLGTINLLAPVLGAVNINGGASVSVVAPQVSVISPSVDLGGIGGPAVARVGDPVAGGVIAGGSPFVRST